jgi:hypothetical protein
LLGICPAPKSWAGFWEVFNALSGGGDGGNNWVTQLIRFFPEGEERDRARRVFRSMMLPAHSDCNRNIKRELSPIGISMSTGGQGDITADINKGFDDMTGRSYVERVIEPSIDAINGARKKSKLSTSSLDKHKTEWVKDQIVVFNEIAWLLNSIDQRNNRASLVLIKFLYNRAANSASGGDIDAFIELVSDLLDFKKGVINAGNIRSLIYDNLQAQLIIMTKLTLVVEALLVEFQVEVQTLVKEYTHDYSSESEYYGSPDTATTGSVTGSPFDTEFYDNLSPAGNKDQKRQSSSDDYGTLPPKIESDMLLEDSGEGTTSYAESAGMEDMHSVKSGEGATSYAESVGMDYDNEYMNRVGARPRPRPKTKKNTDINMRNQAIKDIANRAVRNTYGTAKLRTASEAQLTAVARNAAYGVLINQELHNNKISRNARHSALDAAVSALKRQKNDQKNDNSFIPELGGGSRKRKYTTTRRRSTRKRRPSKKPRRTIRRQRRNNKRTQKSRK